MGLKDFVIKIFKKDKPITGMHHGAEGFLKQCEIGKKYTDCTFNRPDISEEWAVFFKVT